MNSQSHRPSSSGRQPPASPAASRRLRFLPLVAGGAAAVLAAVLAVEIIARAPEREPASNAERAAYGAARAGGALPALWPVPAFRFVDQDEAPRTERDLLGRVWIADFIFTTCSNVCPMLSAELALLMRELPDPELRFVSFSVDPAHDTPAVLRAYAQRWRPGEARWSLLATDPEGLAALAQGMRVAVEPTRDSQNPILHSSAFFLVDGRGQVRGVYASNDREALRRLVADARGLRGTTAARAAGAALDGAALYRQLSCAGCHENPRLAPDLLGLAGAEVRLESGGVRRADGDYVREALTAPGRELTAGYLNIMPAYGDRMTSEELDALVGYVLSLGASPALAQPASAPPGVAPPAPPRAPRPASAPPRAVAPPARAPVTASPPPPSLATDPVCQMQVRVTRETPHATFDGEPVYFCSEMCRDRFTASHASAP